MKYLQTVSTCIYVFQYSWLTLITYISSKTWWMFGIFIFFPKRFLDMTADIIINLIVSMNTYKPFKEWNRCSLMLFVWFWFLVDGFFVYVCEVLFIIFFLLAYLFVFVNFCLFVCFFFFTQIWFVKTLTVNQPSLINVRWST